MHVSVELVKEIWTGQYINLSLLLKKGGYSNALTLVIGESGQIELKQKSARTVQNIGEWTDAFIIFAAILTKKNPEVAVELFQYMALIREAEARSQYTYAWRQYDENFRMR